MADVPGIWEIRDGGEAVFVGGEAFRDSDLANIVDGGLNDNDTDGSYNWVESALSSLIQFDLDPGD